jgi:zinc protease
MQSAITQSLDDPETVVDNHFAALVHGVHPYARPTIGDELSVGGLTREDLIRFHETYWRPNNATFAIAGDVSAEEAFAAAEKAFGGWERADIPIRQPAPQVALVENRVRSIDREDLTQSQIRIGHLGLPRTTPDYFPLLVMNYILGGGGFASRMTAEVRAKAGLSYDAHTVWSYGTDPGTFTISTFTKNATVKAAIDTALGVVRRFRDEGPTPAELEQAKAYYVGAFPFGFQTPASVAESWLRTQYFGLGDDYLDRYRERVQAVTSADVQRVAKKYLRTEKVAIAVVGRGAEVDSQLVGYGKVERVPFTARTGAIPEVQPALPPAMTPDTPESRRRAAAVVAKAVQAHGGRAAFAAIQNWRTRGALSLTMAGQQLDGEFIEIAVPPSRRRMEMIVLGQSMVQVLNGESGFSIAGGRSIPMEDDQLEAMRMGGYSHPVRLLTALGDPKADVRYAGTREFFGKPVETIEWIRPDGRPAQVAFAADTGLLYVLEQPEVAASGGAWLPVQRVYDDYRTSGKIRFPYKTTVYSAGEKAVEQSLAQIEWNVGADAKLFAPTD